ncbi:MAG TPA: hypothetical protein VEY95_11975 [Azospirillaceae bacterium]|nr:hypothetical protein [Azospirillaceae bacterium]
MSRPAAVRRHKRKAVTLAEADIGTPERRNHMGGVVMELRRIADGGSATVRGARAVAECVLDAYHIRAQITDPQYQAGCRLRALAQRAGAMPRVTMPYGERLPPGGDPLPLGRVLARDELTAAQRALTPGNLPAVVAVCLLDEWVGGTRRLMQLRDGLTELAKLWRIN